MLEMSVKDFLKIMARDQETDMTLFRCIKRLGFVEECDYDAHFGAHITYTVDVDNDSPENHESIRKVVQDFIS